MTSTSPTAPRSISHGGWWPAASWRGPSRQGAAARGRRGGLGPARGMRAGPATHTSSRFPFFIRFLPDPTAELRQAWQAGQGGRPCPAPPDQTGILRSGSKRAGWRHRYTGERRHLLKEGVGIAFCIGNAGHHQHLGPGRLGPSVVACHMPLRGRPTQGQAKR